MSCAPAADVVWAMTQPLDDGPPTETLPLDLSSLPVVQRTIAEALVSSGMVFDTDYKPELSMTAPETLERLVRVSVPDASFVSERGDCRRIYKTKDGERHMVMELLQFGANRFLQETPFTLSRQLTYETVAGVKAVQVATPLGVAPTPLSPRRLMVVPLRAAGSNPPAVTGIATLYALPPGATLIDALCNPMMYIRRHAAESTCQALRRLASNRIYATDLTLEDVHFSATGVASVCMPRSQRLTSDNANETIAIAMIASMAGQAARVAGRGSSEDFLRAAFEVSNTPAWRTGLLVHADKGIPSLQKQSVELSEPLVAFCTEVAQLAQEPASIPYVLHAHAPSLMARPDIR